MNFQRPSHRADNALIYLVLLVAAATWTVCEILSIIFG